MSAHSSFRRLARLLTLAAGAFLGAGSAQALQTPGWDVDLSLATFDARGETYTDHSCNCFCVFVPRPLGPGGMQGLCPPFTWPEVPFSPDGVIERKEQQILTAPFFFLGQPIDIGGGVTPNARDMCFFPIQSTSHGTSRFTSDGLGSRTLVMNVETRVNNAGIDTDWYCRGCVDLDLHFEAELANVPSTIPLFLRYDLVFGGNADTTPECPGDPNCQEPIDDTELAEMTAVLDFNGAGPGLLVDVQLDSQAPGLPVYLQNDSLVAVFPPGTSTIDVTLDVLARSAAKHQTPELNAADDANFDGLVRLHLVAHDFLADEPFDSYMRPVPGAYPLRMGRSEVTNQQYADFLNSAEYDAGASELSSFMVFGVDGQVTLADGTLLFEPQGLQPESHVVYTPAAPLGTRYTVEIQTGASARSFEKHPVTHLTWIGAAKFCNWLTLKRGLGLSERCYTEGPNLAEWHPVTITTAAWLVRDLNTYERALLVAGRRGFRLPMDGLGAQSGWIGDQAGIFNEWYRAAAYDPNGPAAARPGPMGETVPARHWIYGVGRDALGGVDANFFASTDPFDEDDAFVALYDGSVYNNAGSELVGGGAAFASAADTNPWGFFDLSGNIAEYVQDRPTLLRRAVRGGSWLDGPEKSAATYRELTPLREGANFIGFRFVQAERGKILPAGAPKPL